MKPKGIVGEKVLRKRDGKTGVIESRELAVSPFSRPGVYGTTIVTINFDDGGYSTGELSWLRSNFKTTL